MDVLADILTVTRLTGDVVSHTLCDPPWGLSYPAASHVWFHIVAAGSCLLVPSGAASRVLASGDLVLLPHGTGHVLCDDRASARITVDLAQARALPRPMRLTTGRAPAKRAVQSELMCGNYTVASPGSHPVLRLLPTIIHLPGRDVMANSGLGATLGLMLREFTEHDVGADKVVARLLEVLFVQVLRHWLDEQPDGSTGWLGGLRDQPIGRALVLLHTEPARAWSVGELARTIGLSRAAFARRFVSKIGDTPLGYLRRLRIELASRLLLDTDDSLAAIGAAVGYTSEFAFNRAFQRDRGTPPGRFRTRVRRR